MKTRQSQATIYKTDRATPRYADDSRLGQIAPTYRGFVIRCEAAELPAKQRQVDEFWSRAYFSAQSQAARQLSIKSESGGARLGSGFDSARYRITQTAQSPRSGSHHSAVTARQVLSTPRSSATRLAQMHPRRPMPV